VDPAAEADVLGRVLAGDVEGVRVGEHARVAVGRAEEQRDLLPARDRLARDLDAVLEHPALEELEWGVPADQLLDRGPGLDLAGSKVVWALWWPGAIHERGGRGHAYIDSDSDDQYEALSRIWRGEEGYAFFEIFNSTFDEPGAVDRVAIDLEVDGKSSSISVNGIADAVMTPLRSPVSGEVNDVRIVKEGGFIWADGEIATNERIKVETPEISFEVAGRHSVFAPFEYANS